MSDSSSLFVNQDDEQPECPFEPFFPDTSDSESESDGDEQDCAKKHADSEVSEDESADDTTYCICQKTAIGFMVGCDGGCENWFHGECVGIKAKQKDLLKHFVCPDCTKNGHGITVWEGTAKGEGVEKQDQDVADASDGEDNIIVSGTNKVLRQNLSTRKRASQPTQLAASTQKKHTGRSGFRAQLIRKRAISDASEFAAAKSMPIAEKLKYSLPTFSPNPPGFRVQPTHRGSYEDDSGSDGDDDDDMDSGARGRATAVDPILSAGTHVDKPFIKVQQRSYIDVEEMPTNVDIMVKKSLEKALFGAQDE